MAFRNFRLPVLLTILTATFCALRAAPAIAAESWLATYEVPVSDPNLKPYALYSISANQEVHSGDYGVSPQEIIFALPAELTGVTRHFTMKPQADGKWQGPGVSAMCAPIDVIRFVEVCDVKFAAFEIDQNLVRNAIRAETSDSTEIAARIQVASAFAGELHGTITIRIH